MELKTLQVLPSWLNELGFVADHRYLFCASETTDAFLPLIGVDAEYIAGGHSYYAAETQLTKFAILRGGDVLTCSLQILMFDEKRIRFLVYVHRGDELVVTIEQMYIHVDSKAGKACNAPPEVFQRLKVLGERHKDLPIPDVVGRHVGQSDLDLAY